MTVNVDTEIDLNIKKITEIIEKLKLLEDKSKMLNFLTISDFAKLRQCSIKTAQDIFNSESFPSENYGKTKVAEIEAVKNWYMEKRDKKDYE